MRRDVALVALCLSPTPFVHAKCFPGQECFPSPAELAAFNASVDGALFSQRPIGAICYPKDLMFDPAECQHKMQSFTFFSDQWISDTPPAYQQQNWAACGYENTCHVPNMANQTVPCGQGSVPAYTVNARTPEHVVEYMKFAVKHDLRIVIKNTGHDFKGRSSGNGGFALWTHLLNSTTRNTSFVPKGCTHLVPQDSVRLGSGVLWLNAYRFAAKEGVTLVGGDAPQVGAGGGWLMGGGHSFLSPSFGMGVDNVLEVDIVTPDGHLQTISECSNPDLFWAIRGGGGGTFGALTSVTYKAHPAMPLSFAIGAIKFNRALTMDDTRVIVEGLAKVATRLGDLGVGGLFNTHFGPIGTYVLFTLPGEGSSELLEAATAPFFEHVKSVMVPVVRSTTLPTFYDFYSRIVPPDQGSGFSAAISSRLIPRSHFTTRHTYSASDSQTKFPSSSSSSSSILVSAIQEGQRIAFEQGVTNLTFQILFAPPSKPGLNLKVNEKRKRKTSVHPVWYESLWHVLYAASWDEHRGVHKAADPVRALTPGGGAYQNEADVYEPWHQTSFWGSNYAKLEEIKRHIDPRNVLQVWHGVGSEEEDELWGCYRLADQPRPPASLKQSGADGEAGHGEQAVLG